MPCQKVTHQKVAQKVPYQKMARKVPCQALKKMARKVPCQALKDERIKKNTLGNGCKFTHANYGTIHQIFMPEFNNPPNIYRSTKTAKSDLY